MRVAALRATFAAFFVLIGWTEARARAQSGYPTLKPEHTADTTDVVRLRVTAAGAHGLQLSVRRGGAVGSAVILIRLLFKP